MPLTPDDIRTYIKDLPDLNTLLEGDYQSSMEMIELNIRMAIADFNSVAPVTRYNSENFPNEAVLLYGTLHHIANGEAERQLRNNVNFSAQGLQAGIDDKYTQYNQLAVYYKQLFDQKAQEMKRFINQEMAWGGNDSPYTNVSDFEFRS